MSMCINHEPVSNQAWQEFVEMSADYATAKELVDTGEADTTQLKFELANAPGRVAEVIRGCDQPFICVHDDTETC